MTERVMLFRPLTGELLHPEVEWETGTDTQRLNEPGSIDFTVPLSWQNMTDRRGRPILADRSTLVVVGHGGNSAGRGHNIHVRQVGLIDAPPLPVGNQLQVTCGGLSMLPAQSGPWEGHQGYYVDMDVMTLFRRIIEQTQSYDNSAVQLQVIGDTRSGTPLGYSGSARWQNANRQANRIRPELDKWESRVVTRERILSQRQDEMFRATGLKRVGTVNVTDNEPDDPGYRADSTLWVRETDSRAHRWRNGRWVSQSQADNEVSRWLSYRDTVQRGKAEVDELKYRLDPIEELLKQYEDEAQETYSLHFWQNHDVQPVIEELMELGPFEYRETSSWDGDRLIPQIEVRSPKVGARREGIRLELNVNVLEYPPVEHGQLYTGLTVFGAGEGSDILSEQRAWNAPDAVRNIMVEVDKEAHNRTATRAAASRLERELRKAAGMGFTRLEIHHDKACPADSFQVGDEIPVTGRMPDGSARTQWVRVLSATRTWGANKTEVEVETL